MTPEQYHSKTVENYEKYINPSLAKLMSFAGANTETHAEGCYLYDHENNKYLDCLGGYGVFSFGHRHPKIVQAVQDQLHKMPLSGKIFFNPVQAKLAEKLAQMTPGNLKFSFFSNSGTEAVECALKFAKCATKRTKLVSTIGGYHGKTIGALSVTGREKFRMPFEPLLSDVVFAPYNDLNAILNLIDTQTAAVIIETVQGEGGIHVASKGYLSAIRKKCTETGALLIVDEVQTGLGRTGKNFGCQHHGIVPDIMTLAKALGGGVMPIAATIGISEIWEKVYLENPLLHTSTFGGNPLGCAAAIAALEVLEEENLAEQAAQKGDLFKGYLEEIKNLNSDLIKEVRGQGLLIGVEFQIDDIAEIMIAQMSQRGVIAAYTLNNRRVIRLEPPLIITEPEIIHASKVFEESLNATKNLLSDIL